MSSSNTPVTVWESLASTQAVAGGIPYIDPISLQPDVDVAGMQYDPTDQSSKFLKPEVNSEDAAAAGNVTINKAKGSVLLAAAAQEVTLTNSFIETTSLILCQILSDDTTSKSVVVHTIVAGSCKIKLNAAATAQVKVGFLVIRAR